MGDGDNKQRLVDISRKDMALLREIDTLANDVVAAVVNVGDVRCWVLGVRCWVMVTRSPTATGLVLRMPFSRKLPFTLQSNSWPSSVRTVYQLPVFLTTSPFTS